MSEKSVSEWIAELKAGKQDEAAQKLWERYFEKLVRLARKELAGRLPARLADEEDVALGAFHSFLRAAEQNRFPQLNDRQDLWQILLDLTEKKAKDQAKYHRRQKRDWRRTQGESALNGQADSGAGCEGLNLLAAPEPTPQSALEVAEQIEHRLKQLDQEDLTGSLRQIALLKLAGYTNSEIAKPLGIVRRSIERKLQRIRALWSQESGAWVKE